MTSVAKDMADLLETRGVGTVGTDIYIGQLPDRNDSPDKAIGVFETGAIYLNPRCQRDELMVQFLARGPQRDYETSYTWAKQVQDAILGIPPQTVNGKSYVLFVSIGGISHTGMDQRERHVFSLNFKIVSENVPGGVRLPF